MVYLGMAAEGFKAMKSPMSSFFYFVRDLRSAELFRILKKHCSGRVVDIGGWDFYNKAISLNLDFSEWVSLDNSPDRLSAIKHDKVSFVVGDACCLPISDNSFDTALSIQVLEHLYKPNEAVREMARILRKGGKAVFLIPQSSNIHLVPHHYYNFTRFWIERACRENALSIEFLKPLGGAFSTLASRLFYFFFQAAGVKTFTVEGIKRPKMFYLLLPLMITAALFIIPLFLIFSLGDLEEEPNNHLVVARKV